MRVTFSFRRCYYDDDKNKQFENTNDRQGVNDDDNFLFLFLFLFFYFYLFFDIDFLNEFSEAKWLPRIANDFPGSKWKIQTKS